MLSAGIYSKLFFYLILLHEKMANDVSADHTEKQTKATEKGS